MKAIKDGIIAVIGATVFIGGAVVAMTMDYSPVLAQIYALWADAVHVLKIGTTG